MKSGEIIRAIVRQKEKYCCLVDTRQWSAFAALFADAPELTFISPDGEQTACFKSLPDFLATSKAFLADARSHHHVRDPQITLISATEASAQWSMEDTIIFPPGDSSRPLVLRGRGHYHETWRLREGEWVIARMELRRTFMETLPQEPLP
jgi:SnoaL-like domain